MMQVFPSSLRDLWTKWELPSMVLLSLSLQLFLIPMGQTRKYTSKTYHQWLLWLAYLSADSIAILSLGILSNGNDFLHPTYTIRAFWAPFFLLHLGGQDTVTAYSTQDNDLWLRHVFDFFVQLTLSFYIFLQSLYFIAIPLFVAGIIKYAERIWVLRSASFEHLRDQIIPFKVFKLRRKGGFKFPERVCEEPSRSNDIQMLHIAYSLFKRNKWVFADLVLGFSDIKQSLYYFAYFDSKTAFKVVELELGFVHDFFYTKAFLLHSPWGALFRILTFSSIVTATITFCTSNKQRYSSTDVYLTFILLFGALAAEIYSFFVLLCSDLCVIWLSKMDSFVGRFSLKSIYFFGWSVGKKRWSNSFPQYNLITACFQDTDFYRNLNFTKNFSSSISDELKDRIFKHLNERVNGDYNDDRDLPDWAVKRHAFYDHLGWSMDLEPAQSILLWHIATEICYYSDHKNKPNLNSSSLLNHTKLLSHYLVYLLCNRHSLFSNGMNRARIKNTIIHIENYLRGYAWQFGGVEDGYEYILRKSCLKPSSIDVKELGITSVFKYGVLLAHELQGMEEHERWEIISHEWVEILFNVARECKYYDHVEQLGHGGDFLTHVWLLMHHIGYTKRAYTVTTPADEERVQEFRRALNRWVKGQQTTDPMQFTLSRIMFDA